MARPTSPKTIVSRLFSASPRPIYVVDPSGRIVFVNQALSNWLDLPIAELLGLRCRYAIQGAGEVANSLAIPPQAEGLPEYRGTIAIPRRDAGSRRAALFLSLEDRRSPSTTLVMVDSEEAAAEQPSVDTDLLHGELLRLRDQWSASYTLDQLIGVSPTIRRVRSQVQLAASSMCRVVIVGQPGSGRETIARTIHRERWQGRNRLIPLSCDLLDAELLQTTVETLVRQTAELGDEGPCTLLLLEVDRLTQTAQSTLLGVLEIPEFEIHTIATCREPLSELSATRDFRSELAEQLGCLEIRLPPLAERIEDIPLLAQWALEKSEHGQRVGGFTAEAMEALLRYDWPREVQELTDVVATAASTSKGTMVGMPNLPEKLAHAAAVNALPDLEPDQIKLDELLLKVEAELIERALRRAKGNRAEAARSLSISRGKLLRRIGQLGLES